MVAEGPTIPDCLGAPAPTAPRVPLPVGACDTHLHVLGPYDRYPLAGQRAYTVPEAPLAALRRYMDVTGLSRVVIAHVSAAGKSLDVTLDAIAALGDAARGTLALQPDMDARRIDELHAAGIRGARLSHAFGDAITPEHLHETARRIEGRGWHIAIWLQHPGEVSAVDQAAGRIGVPIVLDHLAGNAWSPTAGPSGADFERLIRLLAGGHVWLELSAMNRCSAGAYAWPDLLPFARRLIAEVPERLLWASDWPHVGIACGPMPLAGEMLDWLQDAGATMALRERILVANPQIFFGFAETLS